MLLYKVCLLWVFMSSLGIGSAPHERRTVKILSLEGSSTRGIIPSVVLLHLEEKLLSVSQRRLNLTDYFDVIAAQSSSCLPALLLGLGRSSEEITRFFYDHFEELFLPIANQTYQNSPESLEGILNDIFGDFCLSDLKTSVLVPIYDLGQKCMYVFNSDNAKEQRSCNFQLKDVARAAFAEKGLFPQAKIQDRSGIGYHTYIRMNSDSPIFEITAFVQNKFPKCDLQIIAIGCGGPPRDYGNEGIDYQRLEDDENLLYFQDWESSKEVAIKYVPINELVNSIGVDSKNKDKLLAIGHSFCNARNPNYKNGFGKSLRYMEAFWLYKFGCACEEKGKSQEALNCYLESSKKGFLDAMSKVSALYKNRGNYTEARYWAEKVAKKRHIDIVSHSPIAVHNLPPINHLKNVFVCGSRPYSKVNYLQEIEREFNSNIMAPFAFKRVILGGMGGVGKSTLALEYAHEKVNFYDYIFWISSSNREKLLSGYRNIARKLEIEYEEDERLLFDKIRGRLSGQRYLLIYDDVFDYSSLTSLHGTEEGHILVTSRCSSGWNDPVVNVEILQPDQAVDFLFKHINDNAPEDVKMIENQLLKDEAEDLSKLLGCLPLALSHAAAYIKYKRESDDNYMFNSYKEDFGRIPSNLMARSHFSSEETVDYSYLISRTLEMAKEASIISKICDQILDCCAYLDPDNIMREIFDGYIKQKQQEIGEDETFDPFSDLRRFSLIQKASSGNFSIHSMVSEELVKKQKREPDLETMRIALWCVSSCIGNFYKYIKSMKYNRLQTDVFYHFYQRSMGFSYNFLLLHDNVLTILNDLPLERGKTQEIQDLLAELDLQYNFGTGLIQESRQMLWNMTGIVNENPEDNNEALTLQEMIKLRFQEEHKIINDEECLGIQAFVNRLTNEDGKMPQVCWNSLVQSLAEVWSAQAQKEHFLDGLRLFLMTEIAQGIMRSFANGCGVLTKSFAKMPNSEELLKASHLFSSERSEQAYMDQAHMIEELANVPSPDDRESIRKQTLELSTGPINTKKRLSILRALIEIKDHDTRENVVTLTKLVCPENQLQEEDEFAYVFIIQALATIPILSIREEIAHQICPLYACPINRNEGDFIIGELAKISDSDVRQNIIQHVSKLFTKNMIGKAHTSIIKNLLKITSFAAREKTVTLALSLKSQDESLRLNKVIKKLVNGRKYFAPTTPCEVS